MLKVPRVLIAGALLLTVGGISASALPTSGTRIIAPAIGVDSVQYQDGGRCFNRCVRGSIFRRCQTEPEARRENCCNLACNRFNNPYW